MAKTLTFVTGNRKKLEEVLYIMGKSIPIVSKKIDLPELQGEIRDISIKKCLTAFKIIQGPVIVEDTSLCFSALKGLPGPYIKWFLDKIGPEGLHGMLGTFDDKRAEAVCTVAYHSGQTGNEVVLFQGKLDGEIVTPRGPRDFGWGPCFKVNGYQQTYAEIVREERNRMSHRYKAFKLLKAYLKLQ